MMTPAYYDFAFILRAHGTNPSILLVQGQDNTFQLPVYQNEPHFWQTSAPIVSNLRQKHGIAAYALRCLQTTYVEGELPQLRRIYALEYLAGIPPVGAAWFTPDTLPEIADITPYTRDQLADWLHYCVTDAPLRPRWAKLGWYGELQKLFGNWLPPLGSRMQQLRAWERGTVWRIEHDGEVRYFKYVPPMFQHEPRLTTVLSRLMPDEIPEVIGFADDWFGMRAYQGTALSETPDITLWSEALRRVARLQIRCLAHVDTFQSMGVPVRGLDWIAAHIGTLLTDEAALRRGHVPLTNDEIARLRALMPQIQSALRVLADCSVPASLEHGDLWTGQIIAEADKFVITDWSDSALTFPWFTLPFFKSELATELPLEGAEAILTLAYLSEWTQFAPLETLYEWYAHTRLLAPLYTALRYYMDILPAMEQQWEMENMLTYNLRLALR
jgi:hypothetical protein